MLSVRALRHDALASTTFDLADGECVAAQGPSGSGKTLLLRAIADLDPCEGTVLLDGHSREAMHAPRWRRLVTYVSTSPGWWCETVGQHFADWSAAQPLLAALGLPEDCGGWPIQRLSTGERQRLGLIRALLLRPRVLLLDEPTSGLDVPAAAAVEELVTTHFNAGASGIWVSHDDAQARRIARRRLVLENGSTRESML